jgi:alkanesulfonate monooxygenase SsuD/methylene tetrahydromethanopterin reductase-like flavin-dependent oxidoreductase (luciferase family)
MRFGLSVPIFGEYGDVRRLADLAAEAESVGWDGFFTWDHLVHPWPGAGPTMDATVVLSAVAMATNRVLFGPMVTPLARRRPVKLAREFASLDHLSGGRVVLSVGLGDAACEFENLGDAGDHRTRAAQLDEALGLVTALWTGERLDHQGTHYTAKDTHLDPASVQRPRIPVWVGGTVGKPGPLRRAKRWEGYLPLKYGAEITADEVREIAAKLDIAGRPDYALAVTDYGGGGVASPAKAQDAGATWWIQSTKPWAESFSSFYPKLHAGPPR